MIVNLEHVGTTIDLPEADLTAADSIAWMLRTQGGAQRALSAIHAHIRDTRDPLPILAGLPALDPLTTSTVLLLDELRTYTAQRDTQPAVCAPLVDATITGTLHLNCSAHGWIGSTSTGPDQQDALDAHWYAHAHAQVSA